MIHCKRLPVLPSNLAILALLLGAAGCHWKSSAERAAEPIVEQNAVARGGQRAWQRVEAMSLSGRLDAGRPRDPVKLAAAYLKQARPSKVQARKAPTHGREAEVDRPLQLPFVMELKRPDRSRVEVRFQGQTAVQVYDGSQGWKLRPFLGRQEVEPFTPEELQVASQQAPLDGPLLGRAAMGSRVELEGSERLEGRDTYRLKVTARDGQARHVWVDAQSGLDVKVDGTRRVDGKPRTLWTTLRDYRPVDGLMVPHLLETTIEGISGSEKIVVERVALNPTLDDSRFSRPN